MACSTLPTLRLVGLVQLAALESWLPVGGCNVLRAQVLEESRHGNESRFFIGWHSEHFHSIEGSDHELQMDLHVRQLC